MIQTHPAFVREIAQRFEEDETGIRVVPIDATLGKLIRQREVILGRVPLRAATA